MAKKKAVKTRKAAPKAQRKEEPEAPKIDWGAVPKLVTDPRLVAPPTLPMRHDHPYIAEEHIPHPEVRLVIRTRYMEQRPHVLAVESALMSTVIIMFFGLLLYMLHIRYQVVVPILFAIWVLLVILLYKHFED